MKKILRRYGVLFLTLCFLTVPTACNQTTSDLYFPTNINNQEMSASMSYEVKDFEQLYGYAVNIIVGNVTDYETYYHPNGLHTNVFSQVEVEETLKGSIEVGEQITISETGQHLDNGTDISIDGVPLLYPGMKVILFLNEGGQLIDPQKTGYGIIGTYLGKFIYHPDGTIYNFSLLGGDNALTLADAQEPLTEEEFRALLPQESNPSETDTTGDTTIETTTADTTSGAETTTNPTEGEATAETTGKTMETE